MHLEKVPVPESESVPEPVPVPEAVPESVPESESVLVLESEILWVNDKAYGWLSLRWKMFR